MGMLLQVSNCPPNLLGHFSSCDTQDRRQLWASDVYAQAAAGAVPISGPASNLSSAPSTPQSRRSARLAASNGENNVVQNPWDGADVQPSDEEGSVVELRRSGRDRG
jgi:hypothetical protein